MVFSQLSEVIGIIDSVKAQGFDPIVLMELPHSCSYWEAKEVIEMLTRFGMRTVVTDGCAFGLKARFGKNAGLPIKKPWRIAGNSPVFLGAFPRRCSCPRHTYHVPCVGQETIYTETIRKTWRTTYMVYLGTSP